MAIFFSPLKHNAQELIRYDIDNPTAAVHYNEFLVAVFKSTYDKLPDNPYPVIGAYTPSHYELIGVKSGVGDCNYIYISTKGILEPGHQYHLSLTIKITEAYSQMPYYQEHFGIALASELFDNNQFGLWPKHFIPLRIQATEELVTVDFEFRPLCTSKYLVLGVFQGPTMDDINCFACPYEFELHTLTIEKTVDPDAEFYYICDGFIEDKLNKLIPSYYTDTIYFDSGSAKVKDEYKAILDSLPDKLRTVQDLIYLYAYTDKQGRENHSLGAVRNTSVRDILIKEGIDSVRILLINYGETKSSSVISQSDRKVEIIVNLGKLYQKYYTEALQATAKGDYGTAQKKMMKYWLRMVPPNKAIYALFDCWGNGDKAIRFRQNLINRIRSKFYKGKKLKFTLDSMFCENLDARELPAYLGMLRLPTYKGNCDINNDVDWQKKTRHIEFVDQFYLKNGFPSMEQVGKQGNQTLPSIILKSNDLTYLQRYLPLVKTACEKKNIPWKYYARLYDKISVKLTGFQRYGTNKIIGDKGKIRFLYPLENVNMLAEYRKQVKLAPMPVGVKTETEENQKNLDESLITILNTIHQSDQRYRIRTRRIEQKYGRESKEMKSHWRLIKETDSLNLINVKNILNQKGWLSPKIIGNQGNSTLFLVIQHAADLETQLHYLPMFREAVNLGNARASDLALLEDRVALGQDKRQIYGSQIGRDNETGEHYVLPLIDPESVNERRAEVGLGTIGKYISHWGITWDLDNHKKRTIKIELEKNKF